MMITKRRLLATAASLYAGSAAAQSRPTTLRYALTTMPNVIDPHFSTGFQVRDITYAVFDTLFAVDDHYQPKPQMVDRWTVSDDGMTYRFTLRDGLRWHDGPAVTAEECVLSIRRWWARDAMGSLLREATGSMAALDDKSFEIVLKQPFAFVLDALAKPGSNVPAMLPKRLAELSPTQPIKELIGSGPFKYVPAESLADQKLVFVKNTDYVPRQEPPVWASGGKVVKVDRLEMIAIPDPSTQFNALLNGEVDYIERLQADLMPLLQTTARGKIRTIHSTWVQLVIRLNHLQPPFDNVQARRALLLAVSQQDMVDATVGTPELGRPCPAIFGCDGPYASDAGAPKPDLAAAKQMLAASGVDLKKPVVQLLVPNDPTIAPAAQVLGQTLKDLGFALDQQVVDFATFAQRRLKMGPVEEGGWNIGNTTIGTTELANPLVAQPVIASGRFGYWGWPSDPAVEKLRADFATASDPARRTALAAAIQQAVYDTVVYIPGGEVRTTSAIGTRVAGALDAPMVLFWNATVG
jgi:peptide/nickel transport system substrate-binding protein